MSAVICPTVTAFSKEEYAQQIKNLTPFAERVHIDLMDGEFAPTVSPGLDDIWWPHKFTVDIHLMYQRPMNYIDKLVMLKPNLVVIHVESMFHHMHFAAELHKEGINVGLAVLPDTPIKNIAQIISSFDHILIFSGDLGKFGGQVNLDLLEKVKQVKQYHPDIEVGWDGGINATNSVQLAAGGIDVLNTGGFIQKSANPEDAYKQLVESLQ